MGQNDAVMLPIPWSLVIPVKEADAAKSRLITPLTLDKPAFVRAMAMDVLSVALELVPAPRIFLVSNDSYLTKFADEHRIRTVADPQAGLNEAIIAGLANVPAGPVAVLLADVPALRPEDLTKALAAARHHSASLLADAEGTGTVLLTSQDPMISPSFGPGSAAKHATWATPLQLELPHLQRDVDRAEDLVQARALGVGPRTAAAWPAAM